MGDDLWLAIITGVTGIIGAGTGIILTQSSIRKTEQMRWEHEDQRRSRERQLAASVGFARSVTELVGLLPNAPADRHDSAVAELDASWAELSAVVPDATWTHASRIFDMGLGLSSVDRREHPNAVQSLRSEVNKFYKRLRIDIGEDSPDASGGSK